MCTIGAVKNRKTGTSYFFKNVDQTDSSDYIDPQIVMGRTYKYLKLATGSSVSDQGVWAGVNEAGVVILGADGNCMPNYVGKIYTSLNESLVVYERILSECASVNEASSLAMQHYQEKRVGGNGDIIIIGDRKEAIAVEYSPNRWGIQYRAENAYILRSNFFILLNQLRPQPEENSLHTSSALRYQDALEILSIKGHCNTLEDIFGLVRSHRHGPSAMSICRHGGPGEYFTRCSLVVELTSSQINAYVGLNEHPCTSKFNLFKF